MPKRDQTYLREIPNNDSLDVEQSTHRLNAWLARANQIRLFVNSSETVTTVEWSAYVMQICLVNCQLYVFLLFVWFWTIAKILLTLIPRPAYVHYTHCASPFISS